jgi:hypothetical protein
MRNEEWVTFRPSLHIHFRVKFFDHHVNDIPT